MAPEISQFIKNGKLRILVKTNAAKTEVIGWDEQRKVLKVSVKEAAIENKANISLVKFFSKKLKKKVRITSGLKSKEKLLEIV